MTSNSNCVATTRLGSPVLGLPCSWVGSGPHLHWARRTSSRCFHHHLLLSLFDRGMSQSAKAWSSENGSTAHLADTAVRDMIGCRNRLLMRNTHREIQLNLK